MSDSNKNSMKMYVLDNGRLQFDKNFLVSGHNPANIHEPNKPNTLVEVPVYTVLIDHPDGKILFDTGCHPDAMGENGRWTQGMQDYFYHTDKIDGKPCHVLARLEELNIDPLDIDYVVMSHLHLDHTGCLEFFTNAKILVHHSEFNEVLKDYAQNEDGVYVWKDIDSWIKNKLTWQLVEEWDEDFELVKGVRILNLGSSHAYGMLSLHVDMPQEGGIIMVADAIYSAENYGPPARLPGTIYDSLGFLKGVEKIRKLADATGSQVWFGHDMEQFNSLTKSTEGYYE